MFIGRVEGCTVLDKYNWPESHEISLNFTFSGYEFEVSEPFGDHDRLLVCPADVRQACPPDVIESLKEKFEMTERFVLLGFFKRLLRHGGISQG